jgi:hypothetical protein
VSSVAGAVEVVTGVILPVWSGRWRGSLIADQDLIDLAHFLAHEGARP